jgi:dsDNA-specific endonuclease/ATPase MutS2
VAPLKINKKGRNKKMRFYSDITKQIYETEEELKSEEARVEAERAEKKRASEERQKQYEARKTEVDNAIKEADEAMDKADSLMKAFIRDFGYPKISIPRSAVRTSKAETPKTTSTEKPDKKIDNVTIDELLDILFGPKLK